MAIEEVGSIGGGGTGTGNGSIGSFYAAPAKKDKFVLPSSFVITTTPTKFMYQTIPQAGLYLITGFFNAVGVGGGVTYMQFYLAKNGVVISGLKQEPYTVAAGSQFPVSFAITEDLNAGDEIAVYGYVTSGSYSGRVYTDSTREAFLQYTQLSKFVPTITTVTKEYGHFYLYTANKSYSTNEVIKMQKDFGNIAYDQSTGYVYLKAGVSYRCTGSILGNSGQIGARFYNVTSGQELGQLSYTRPINANTADSINPICDSMITPTIDTIICFRVNNSSSGAIYGDSPYLYSSMHIESIEANIPVVATLGQDAWVGALQDLLVTSRGIAKVAGMTKVKFSKDSGGQWFAEYFVAESISPQTTTGNQWYLTGITHKNTGVANTYHRLSGGTASVVVAPYYCIAYSNSNRIDIYHANTAGVGSYDFSGKVPLENKPVGYGIPDSI